MKREAWIIVSGAGVLLVLATLVLGRLQTTQRLGTPGLRVVAQPIHDEVGKVAGTNSVYLPERVLDYTSEPAQVTQLELNWLPPDTTFGRRVYRAPDGFEALISVVLMGADRTSIHKPQYCLLGQGFSIDSSVETVIPVGGSKPFDLRVMKLLTSKTEGGVKWRGVYLYWFVADGQQTANHSERMWWMARDLLRDGVLQRWAYVTSFAICRPGAEDATFERMKTFLAAAVPTFHLDPRLTMASAPASATSAGRLSDGGAAVQP